MSRLLIQLKPTAKYLWLKKKGLDSLFWLYQENTNFFFQQVLTNKYLSINFKLTNQKISMNIDDVSYDNVCNEEDLYISLEEFFEKYSEKNDEIKRMFCNKRIVIVGPADYVNNGNEIDKYDIIIRLNKGYNMKDNGRYGSRTDLLYHVVNQHRENGGLLKDFSNKTHIRFIYPILKPSQNTSFKNIGTIRDYLIIKHQIESNKLSFKQLSIINKDDYEKMENLCDSRPNGGLATILDLLNYDIKELYITGFTLFSTNYSNNYRNKVDGNENTSIQAQTRMKRSGHHDQYKSAHVYKNILKDTRVKYDNELRMSIDELLKT